MTNDLLDELVQCAFETVAVRVDRVMEAFSKLEELFTVEYIFVHRGELHLVRHGNETCIDNFDGTDGSLGCMYGADIREHPLIPKGKVVFTTDGTLRKLRGSVAIMER